MKATKVVIYIYYAIFLNDQAISQYKGFVVLYYVISLLIFKRLTRDLSSKLNKLSGYVKYMDKGIETYPTKLQAKDVKSIARLDDAHIWDSYPFLVFTVECSNRSNIFYQK